MNAIALDTARGNSHGIGLHNNSHERGVFHGETNIKEIREFSHQLQIRIANILTRAISLHSIDQIIERVEKLVRRVTGTNDIIIGFSETEPLGNEDTFFIRLRGEHNLYLCVEGVPEAYRGIVETMLKNHRKQLQNALRSFDQNHRDELTKLYNLKLLTKKQKQLDATDINYIVFYFDVVGLGETNDTIGHYAGDALLTTFSNKLQKAFGTTKNITVLRHGGDEFMVIIEMGSSYSPEELKEEANKYLQFLKQELENQSGEKPTLNAKVGVSIRTRGDGRTSTEIIGEADPKGKKEIRYILEK